MKTNITLRPATPADLDAIASIYASLWCTRMMRSGMEAEARLCSRFISSALALRSPQAMVAVNDGGLVVGTCLAGVAGQTNEAWRADYERLLAEATERAKTADENLEGSLFGDIRELATADAFIASGNA